MPTPSIQTLRTDAQQVLNLDSISAVRSVVAATLANANAGTPLNPNLTTQQLWNEFYQIVTQPKSDIESIIANQLMKFLYAPPAPGGVGADGQVIFNDGGVLAGDPQFLWNKTTNLLTVTGSATITGDLTVRTNKLAVTSAGVGFGTTSPNSSFQATLSGLYGLRIQSADTNNSALNIGNDPTSGYAFIDATKTGSGSFLPLRFGTSDTERYRIAADGVATWSNVGGVAGTAMTLNSTGLGIGASPSYKLDVLGVSAATVASGAAFRAIRSSSGDRCLIVPLAAGSGFTIQSQNAAESDFTPIIFSGSTTTFNYRTGIGTVTTGMTLDASGNLLLATTTNTPSARQYINQASGSNPALYIAGGASTTPLINFNGAGRMRSDGQYLVMETTNASGVIYVTANTNGVYLAVGGTSWTANSDERLKDIIEPINNAVAKVGSLRSVIGKFKNDETNTRRSFLIAQDVQAVLPEAVDASNPDRLGVAYSEVIPLLVAAIKELTARVQTLEAK